MTFLQQQINFINFMKKIFSIILASISFLPLLSFAAADSTNSCAKITLDTSSIGKILNYFTCLIKESVMPLLITLAVVGFIWGVIQFFLGAENEDKRKKGKQFMIWGLIAIFVIVSVWGLVGVISSTFGIDKTIIPQLSNE